MLTLQIQCCMFHLFYYSQTIVDPVTVVLPWAVDEIIRNIKGITDAFGNILTDPKTSIANIGSSATRFAFRWFNCEAPLRTIIDLQLRKCLLLRCIVFKDLNKRHKTYTQ